MNSPFDFANYYSDLHWLVFPCKKDKKPMTEHGVLDATLDKAKIAEWWGRNPAANIGIRTGEESGIFVLDIDSGHGGDATLMTLQGIHGTLPKTVISNTGGGGRHLVFEYPKGIDLTISQGKIGPGLDTRGNRGYIVAPPSIHETGKMYLWDRERAPSKTPLAPLPDWIIAALLKPDEKTAQASTAPAGQDENVYPKGTRHAAMVSLAGTMRRRGLTEKAILAAILLEAERFVPPATTADIEALKETVKRVCKYEPTAALANVKAGRVQVEWSFAKSLYEIAYNLPDFEWVKPEWFGEKVLGSFWAALLETRDPIAAAARSGTLSDLQAWNDYNADRVDAYAKEIARYGYLDGISKAAQHLQRLADEGDLSKITGAIRVLADEVPIATVAPQDADASLTDLENQLESGSFIKTGVGNIDEAIGGLEMKAMSILAARPGMGKTSLAWQIARNAALNGTVLFFSLEVASVKLWRKAALGIAEVSPSDIANKKVSPEKLQQIYQEIIPQLKETYRGRLYTYDQITDTDIMWRMASQLQPTLIIIDHMRYMDDEAANEIQRLGLISKRGKQYAKTGNGCHVMFLHQLSRAVTSRDDKAPQLTDMRESGHVEENADQVFMIHRDDYYKADENKLRYSPTSVIVRKNRDDVSGVPFGLFYDLSHQWFYRQDEIPSNYKEMCLDGKMRRTVGLGLPTPRKDYTHEENE